MATATKRLQAAEIMSKGHAEGLTPDQILGRIATEMYGDHATPLVPARRCYVLTKKEGFCTEVPALARQATSAKPATAPAEAGAPIDPAAVTDALASADEALGEPSLEDELRDLEGAVKGDDGDDVTVIPNKPDDAPAAIVA